MVLEMTLPWADSFVFDFRSSGGWVERGSPDGQEKETPPKGRGRKMGVGAGSGLGPPAARVLHPAGGGRVGQLAPIAIAVIVPDVVADPYHQAAAHVRG